MENEASIKIGELYILPEHHSWALKSYLAQFTETPLLYLGPDTCTTTDGKVIVNHAFFINGERRLFDVSLAYKMRLVNESR